MEKEEGQGREVLGMNQNFTYVRSINPFSSSSCSVERGFLGLSRQAKNFTAVTLLDSHCRGILWNLKNGLYFIFLRILRTYGTYVPFMIEIERDRERTGGGRDAQ